MIVLKGVAEFNAALQATIEKQALATRLATGRAAHLIERRAKEHLTRYSHRRGEPTPSPPGDPPALVSGNLRRSVQVDGPDHIGPGMYKAQIGPTARYGRIQELGGQAHHASLPARPYMAPALKAAMPEVRAIYKEAWRKAL